MNGHVCIDEKERELQSAIKPNDRNTFVALRREDLIREAVKDAGLERMGFRTEWGGGRTGDNGLVIWRRNAEQILSDKAREELGLDIIEDDAYYLEKREDLTGDSLFMIKRSATHENVLGLERNQFTVYAPFETDVADWMQLLADAIDAQGELHGAASKSKRVG
jgi:hypothetical protein